MEIHLVNGNVIKNILHISQLNGVFTLQIQTGHCISERKINTIEIDSIEIKEQ